jgi:hypothetical protein
MSDRSVGIRIVGSMGICPGEIAESHLIVCVTKDHAQRIADPFSR